MTPLGTVITILVCVGLGYVVEPVFRSLADGKPAPEADAGPKAGDAGDSPAGQPDGQDAAVPEPAVQVDLSKVTKADFPDKVALKVGYTVTDAESGATVTLKKGSLVKPLRLEGTDLVIQPSLVPIQSKIDVDKTNFKELVAPRIEERLRNAVAEEDPAPAEPMQADPGPEPPAPPAPEPEPEPEPEPAAVPKLGEAAVVALLKQDVEAGNVTEFKANQVTAWKAGEDMEFDGETYQTGRVTFRAQTILGVQEHEAIALIEDGKVYKWMWAKTKLEMR